MDLLPLVDLSRPDRDGGLAFLIRRLRGLMLKSLKLSLFENVLRKTDAEGGNYNTIKVNINRHRAANFTASGRCDVRGRRTVFGQLFQQLHSQPKNKLRKQDRAWKVVFQGEHADDYGGPYRESIAQLSQELMSPQLPLLVPTANNRNQVGQNQDRFVPNPSATRCVQAPNAVRVRVYCANPHCCGWGERTALSRCKCSSSWAASWAWRSGPATRWS